MSSLGKIISVRKFPLEAEAIATMAQHELTTLTRDELLAYSQQMVLVMSQLRHYCTEIVNALEERGFSINGHEG